MLNPHVSKIHLPAHGFGLLALAYTLMNPTWVGLVAFLFFNFWFSGLGMSIGFHRYFTHRAFATSKFWRYVMLLGGTLAGQGSVVFWVALHRLHHPYSDKEPDIHTPTKGFFHAYMGWIFTLDPLSVPMARAGDIIKDPICKFAHRHYNKILWVWWSLLIGLSFFETLRPICAAAWIAGMWSIHQEALINSVCHDIRFGKRDHETNDNSRNVGWLHYITWGQSLHNTHHAYPGAANFALSGSDLGHRVIRAIEA